MNDTYRRFIEECRDRFVTHGDNAWATICNNALAGKRDALKDCRKSLCTAVTKLDAHPGKE